MTHPNATETGLFKTPEHEPIPRLALRPAEFAIAVGVSPRTVADWIKLDGFPTARVGGVVMIPIRESREWLARQAERDS